MTDQTASQRTRSLTEKLRAEILGELMEQERICKDRIERGMSNMQTRHDGSTKNGNSFEDACPVEDAEVSIAVVSDARRIINRINVVMRMITDGTYGVCKGCNKDIEEVRLRALPYATRCKDCADKDEAMRLKPRPGTQITRAGVLGSYVVQHRSQ